MYNHSDDPNCTNIRHGDTRYLVTIKPVKKGEELTADYRFQKDLEELTKAYYTVLDEKYKRNLQ